MILYHGTDSKFNKFSKSKIGSNTNVTSVGFFFTDNYNTAKSYGDTVLKCDVDLGAYIECDFDGNSTYYFGEEKWYTPNMLAERIDELNKDIANYGYSIGNMSREEAEEYMDYLGQDGGYGHLYDDKIDSIICKNIKDNMDFGGELSNNYIIFDENRIKVLGNVNERLEDIGKCFITKSAYDIVNLLKNKPKEYRILYDNRIKMYMIGDANDITHWDMIQDAYKNALYYDQEDFIEELGGTLDNYVDIGQSGFWDGDTEEENIEPYLWYIVFSPNEEWTLGTDGYNKKYDYPFGHVFTRGCDLDEIDLWDALGVPENSEKLNELYEAIEKLQDSMNMFGEDENVYSTKSDYDILNLLKNKYEFARFIWDSKSGYYIISNGDTCIHADLGNIGYKQAILESPFVKEGVVGSLTYSEFDDEDESRSLDGCNYKYKYPFGFLYTKFDMSLEEMPLYKSLGQPIEKTELIYDKNIYESLNRKLERYL